MHRWSLFSSRVVLFRSIRTAKRSSPVLGADVKPTKKKASRSKKPLPEGVPKPGALLENEDLVEGAKSLVDHLDHEGEEDEDFMEGVVVKKQVVDLSSSDADRTEEEFFRSFFGKKEPMIDAAADEELKRKLGTDSTVPDAEVQELREREEGDQHENVVLKGVRGNVTSKRPGFQQRGQREELQELEDNEKKQRERQRRIHVDDDRLYVGDVLVPFHLEKWVLEPEGDHKRRHKKQRLKEERLAKWYEEHGMYYERKKKMGFRRDPVEQNLTIRQRRIGLLIKSALELVFAEDLEHEHVPGIMVEDVQISVDMKKAKVLWNSLEPEESVSGFLHRVGPAIRMLVTKRIQLKFSPDLVFIRTDFARKEEALEGTIERMREQRILQQTQQQLQDEDLEEEEEEEEEQLVKSKPSTKARKKTSTKD